MQPTATAATASSGTTAKSSAASASSASGSGLKLELAANSSPTQVITVVAPSSQSHSAVLSNPVVVQVSSGGQLIVAVSPDNIANSSSINNNSQSADVVNSVDTPGTTSNEDEDGTSAGFDDFAPASYTNGNSNPSSMTYFSAENTYNTTSYYNYNSQTVNQIIADGGAYLVMESGDPGSGASTSQRASPQTVQWLIENYETAEGVSLPRSTLYTHYQNHCQQHSIEPVNAASFGKLIRSVFIGLRTRRLGTRGNSKYHYYGIRVKPGSTLSRIVDSSSAPATPEPTPPPTKKIKSSPVAAKNNPPPENPQATLSATSPDILQTHLGDPKAILPSVWPDEPTIPSHTDSDSPSVLATKFAACYRKHYEEIINALGNLNFSHVEQIWSKFWQPESRAETKSEEKNRLSLSLSQLHQLTSTATVTEESSQITSLADWIIQTDYTLYNALITSLLLPNLLKPIPQQLTQQIRNFAKNISQWMTSALCGYDETFIVLKLGAVGAFSHTLRRYTSLNHLSSAARAVLQNQQQISQMISDLNRVDFKNVQEQASWVCNCDDEVVEQIEQSFKSLLQQESPFDRWGSWCDQVLDSCLTDANVSSATQFFFKWGFYSSLVMRDLTLRSASSFGSFHLIRLLFDEYIFYLIEHRVAKATSKTPLQVLGEARALRAHVSAATSDGASA